MPFRTLRSSGDPRGVCVPASDLFPLGASLIAGVSMSRRAVMDLASLNGPIGVQILEIGRLS